MTPQYFSLPCWQSKEYPAPRVDVWPLFREARWDITHVRTETAFMNAMRVVLMHGLRCELCGDYLHTDERTIDRRMHAVHFWDVFVVDTSPIGFARGAGK